MAIMVCSCATKGGQSDLEAVALSYAKESSNPALHSKLKIEIEEIKGEYARALLSSQDGNVDPATVYLKKTDGAWKGITLGTGFSPEDYLDLGIPSNIQR